MLTKTFDIVTEWLYMLHWFLLPLKLPTNHPLQLYPAEDFAFRPVTLPRRSTSGCRDVWLSPHPKKSIHWLRRWEQVPLDAADGPWRAESINPVHLLASGQHTLTAAASSLSPNNALATAMFASRRSSVSAADFLMARIRNWPARLGLVLVRSTSGMSCKKLVAPTFMAPDFMKYILCISTVFWSHLLSELRLLIMPNKNKN